jgi:hypothetical protein
MVWKQSDKEITLVTHTIASCSQGFINGNGSMAGYTSAKRMPKEVRLQVPPANQIALVYQKSTILFTDSPLYKLKDPMKKGKLHATFVSPNVGSPNPRYHFQELFVTTSTPRVERFPIVTSEADVGVGMLIQILNGTTPCYIRDYFEKMYRREPFSVLRDEATNPEMIDRLQKLQQRVHVENDLHDLISFLKNKK